MQTVKTYWSYFRNTLGTLILLLPFFLAAWVFHLAMGLGNGSGDIWMGIMGAGAVLLLFRRQWRLWVILFPELWRLAARFAPDLVAFASIKLRRAQRQVRNDWRDLRRSARH